MNRPARRHENLRVARRRMSAATFFVAGDDLKDGARTMPSARDTHFQFAVALLATATLTG